MIETIPSPAMVYKTQRAAVALLQNAGFTITPSTFNRHFKEGKIGTNGQGHFEEGALMGYAAVHLDPVVQRENKDMSKAQVSKMEADAELKANQAALFKLKLETAQGKVMPRADYERDLAARALFFKREIQNFIHLHGAAIIHLVKGAEGMLPALINFWADATAVWMNAWSIEREFVVDAPEAEQSEEAE